MNQESAYNRYRNGITKGTRIAISPNAIHQDFVNAMETSRTPSGGLGIEFHDRLLVTDFVCYYEQGLPSMGPSAQLITISRTGNDYHVNMFFYAQPMESMELTNCTVNHSDSSLELLSGTQRVLFEKFTSNQGVSGIRFEHFSRHQLRTRLNLVEITL